MARNGSRMLSQLQNYLQQKIPLAIEAFMSMTLFDFDADSILANDAMRVDPIVILRYE